MKWIVSKISYVRNKYPIEAFVLIIAGIILLNTLFIYPVIGKSDNGDFGRFMNYGGLDNLSSEYKKIYDGFVHLNYIIDNPRGFLIFYVDWVSGTILLKIAVLIFLIVHQFQYFVFDIRYLAFVYSIVFLTGIFLIVNYNRFSKLLKAAAGIFMILFFTSSCYIAYFNSFYGEASTIVFFLLNIGTYLYLISRKNLKIIHFVYFFIASGAFLTAKSQNIPLILFMLMIYAGLYIYYKDIKFRRTILLGSIAVTVLCSISYLSLTDLINENNLYQSVFFGVLKNSKMPEKDLEELGLNKKFIAFSGHSFYKRDKSLDPIGKEMKSEFYPNISNWRILGFYLRHLDILGDRIADAADNAYGFGKPGKWNFIKGEYTKGKIVNEFRTFLIDKFPKLHRNVTLFAIFSIIYLLISLIYLIKSKDPHIKLLNLMVLFILVAGSSQFVLPMIGSGHCDFQKHLFLLNFSYDIMFGISILWILHIAEMYFKRMFRTY